MKTRCVADFTRAISKVVLLAVLVLTLSSSSARSVREFAFAQELFVDGPEIAHREISPTVEQRRTVRIDQQALQQSRRVGGRVQLNLFPDRTFIGNVEGVELRSDSDYTLIGHLEGEEYSSFVAVVSGEVVMMNIRPGREGLYQVRYVEGDLHVVHKIDETQFPPCETGPAQAIDAAPVAAKGKGDPTADAGNVIDVMVVYTPSARAAAGGTSAIQALINLAITESNTAYQQSLINPRLRLVYVGEIAYTEASTFSQDLTRLQNPSDGYMDEVHTLRNLHGADMVSLWVNNSASCGIGYLMNTLSSGFEAYAFSTVHYSCATGYYSFGHELGHNMGCAHDRDNAGGGLNPYSYGWRFHGTNGVQYRTIMAYAPGTRIQRFSNPDVTYFGTPTGVPIGNANQAHNAQTINNSAFTIANFRQSSGSPVIATQPQSQTVAAGATASFSVSVTGTPPFTYQWRKNGSSIASATASSYTIHNVQAGDAGNYSVVVSNSVGSATSSVAVLSVGLSIGAALDAPGFNWITGGNASWIGQTAVTYDGVDAAASGTISHDQFTALQTTMVGPATLTFWWKVSSEQYFDWLDLFVNGQPIFEASGEVNWTFRSVALPPGTNVVQWQYMKDESVNAGQDRAWVDQVVVIAPSTMLPQTATRTNGQFRFQFEGAPGASYTIYGSTNMTSWNAITNLWSTSSPLLFVDPATNGVRRFYRVASP
ncbi:MAG: M12 family metallo-peptidase [Limisphaerales bacterium]